MSHPPPGGVMGPEAPEAFKRHPGRHPGGTRKAGEGTRTLDIQLGKLALYQLSYARG